MTHNKEQITLFRADAEDIDQAFSLLRKRVHTLIDGNRYEGLPDEVTEGLSGVKYIELINFAAEEGLSADDIFAFIIKSTDYRA
jgi:hypothetical protein